MSWSQFDTQHSRATGGHLDLSIHGSKTNSLEVDAVCSERQLDAQRRSPVVNAVDQHGSPMGFASVRGDHVQASEQMRVRPARESLALWRPRLGLRGFRLAFI